MESANADLDKLVQELRRGTITIAVLSQLSQEQYGYSLVTKLNEKGFQVEAGTLYPMLRRLEKQGLLESEWDTNESRPRKYYSLSKLGHEAYNLLVSEWKDIVNSLEFLVENEGDDFDGAN